MTQVGGEWCVPVGAVVCCGRTDLVWTPEMMSACGDECTQGHCAKPYMSAWCLQRHESYRGMKIRLGASAKPGPKKSEPGGSVCVG